MIKPKARFLPQPRQHVHDGAEPNIQHQHDGTVRTSMNCHACSHGFLALIDYAVDGPIIVACPHCGHKHYRRVDKGVMTEDRPTVGHDPNEKFQFKAVTWKHPELPATTTTTSEFLRHRWLNLANGQKGK